jgi:hypothetical protein
MIIAKSISGFIILFSVLFFILCQYNLQQVYSDGLTQENLAPVNLGNREGGLFIKINPPVYTTETKEDSYMQFRLFDAGTNETVSHVTYNITVNKDAILDESKKPLMSDLFHSHEGLLTLKVEHTNDSLSIFGDRSGPHSTYMSDSEGTVNLKGPLLQEGGLYRFDVQILGIDNDQNTFAPEKVPKYGAYLSMGDTFDFKDLDYEDQKFNTTLISYYDKINDFDFNSTTGEFSWSMPFDYNTQRLEENPILVHEEIKLPKDLFGSNTFNATVNGKPISGRNLAVDPFTSPNSMILHYLVDKNDLTAIANQWQQQAGGPRNGDQIGTMDFRLLTNQPTSLPVGTSLGSNGSNDQSVQSATAAREDITSFDLISDTGGIIASVLLSQSPTKTGTESVAKIKFTDMFSGEPLKADVIYDLVIFNSNNSEVVKKDGLIAKNSQDTQPLLFPTPGKYEMSLTINGLQMPNGREQGDASPTDRTRNGIASGSVQISK